MKTIKDKKTSTPRRNGPDTNDQALIADIRLLGRILGDVIREQEGKATFDLV
ncbi:MAG: hypothetical protein JSS56_17360, partial [Proteobacteria bacterium]|nr:hypothetical protein [Pseudomonadota bacterium]